ncbi:MAG: lipopolysaccharide biosynthesis protein [Candidatus Eiseniibacteriota bacterium]
MLRNVGRGSFYLTVESLTTLLSGLLYSVVVLRWLGPGWFGILSLALSVVGLASVFTGNFELYLERHAAEYEARGQYRLLLRVHLWALALKAVLGFAAGCAVYLLVPWIVAQYGFDRLGLLITLLLALVVFDGFNATARATLYGLQQFSWIAALAFFSNAVKMVAVVVLWRIGRGPTSLALTLSGLAIVSGLLATVIAFAVTIGRARQLKAATPELDAAQDVSARALVGDMVRYCTPLLGARAAFISGQNLSKVVLGKFFPPEALGLFSFAFQTVERFVGLIFAVPSSLLPSLTQLVARSEPDRLRRLLDKGFRLVATLGCALSVCLFVFAEEITRILGGERYLPAVGILRVLALVPLVRTAQQPLTMGFYALRRTGAVLGLAVGKFGIEMGSYFALIPLLGLAGAAWANLAGAVASFFGALALTTIVLEDGGRHRWAVMAKTGSLVALGISVTLLLHAIPWDWRAMFVLKLLIVLPGLFLMVLLLDLVTRDDLARAQAVPISVPWMAALRDRAVAFGFAAGSRIGRVRPVVLATAEGH